MAAGRSICLAAVAAACACTVGGHEPDTAGDDRLAPLRAFEAERRQVTDFETLPPAERILGPDPVDVVALGGSRFAGVLGGDDALVVLDARGGELERVDTPPTPAAVAADRDGRIWVGSRESLEIWSYTVEPGGGVRIDERWVRSFPGSIADLAVGPEGVLYVADRLDGRLLVVDTGSGAAEEFARCGGPSRLARVAQQLLVSCLLDRTVFVFDVSTDGVPAAEPRAAIEHHGPIASVTAAPAAEGLAIALAGVEDRPLDRSDGGFGHIDSFLFLYRLDDVTGEVRRLGAANLSAVGVVDPSSLALEVDASGDRTVRVVGAGSDRWATVSWPRGSTAPSLDARPLPPGAAAASFTGDGALLANPLLDAWVALEADDVIVEPAAGADQVPVEVRVGEALYATTLIAPFNDSEGPRSRFTCQSCHYEGYGDGRTHWTGRDDVYATTRSVRGLFNNRPHFSRALDRTMVDMVDNEFAVMNRHGPRSDWFEIGRADAPWLELLGWEAPTLGPVEARRALMAFLMVYTHETNPAVGGRRSFTAEERRGARLFRDTCERCHRARLSADDPSTRVPFEDWEPLVMSDNGPLVWASAGYRKTGVEPYVHPDGSRVPSLRRLYRKRPYFTNGTAASLDEVLSAARLDPETGAFRHRGPVDAPGALAADERTALRAFLRLL